jgi:hypothetical protein
MDKRRNIIQQLYKSCCIERYKQVARHLDIRRFCYMKESQIKIIKIGDHRNRCQARTILIIWGSVDGEAEDHRERC